MTDRPTARVMLLDPDDRVLLFKNVRNHWVTPGGGVEPGESFADAALRELWEETGISDVVLGPVAIERELILGQGDPFLCREQIFVARTTVTDVSLDNQDEGERAGYNGYRRWTVDELLTTNELVYPEELAERVRDVIGEHGRDR